MAKNYSIPVLTASGTSAKSGATLTAKADIRPIIYDVVIGNSESPNDYAWRAQLQRYASTNDGTGTSVTPAPLDPTDPPALTITKNAHTAEPTSYVSGKVLLEFNANLRTQTRWVAYYGSELVSVMAANEGIGFRLDNATTALILRGTILFRE